MIAAALLAAGIAPSGPIPVRLDTPVLTRADAARLLGRRLGPRAAERRAVLRVSTSGQVRVVTAAALARLTGLTPAGDRRLFEIGYRGRRPVPACRATARTVGRGRPIGPADLVPAPCAKAVPGLLRFDPAARVLAAQAEIGAGTRLGRVVAPAARTVEPGAALTLRATVGPVVVERQVVAMQAGDARGTVFVRGAAGPAFAVPVAAGAGR